MVVPFTTENDRLEQPQQQQTIITTSDIHLNIQTLNDSVSSAAAAAPPRATAPPQYIINNSDNDGATAAANASPSSLENDIYIDFVIIENGNLYNIRGEKEPIMASSEELRKIITGQKIVHRNNNGYVLSGGIQKDIFEKLIRFLETKFIKFTAHEETLKLFEAAMQYNCPELIKNCVIQLDQELCVSNVLIVYHSVRFYCSQVPSPTTKTRNSKKMQFDLTHPDSYTAALLFNCLQFIDQYADEILSSDKLMDLRYEELDMISRRDTLQMSSETILIDALIRWGRAECERKRLDITAENRRRVVGPLIHYPRYLLLTHNQFENSRQSCELLLDAGEINFIQNDFKGKTTKLLTNDQQMMLIKFKRKRPMYAPMPIALSQRSNHKNYSRKMRNYKYRDSDGDDDDDEDNCGNKLCLHFCIFCACICD